MVKTAIGVERETKNQPSRRSVTLRCWTTLCRRRSSPSRARRMSLTPGQLPGLGLRRATGAWRCRSRWIFSRALYSGDGQWSFESGVPAQRKVSHALPDEVRPGPYRGPMSRCLFSTRTEDSIGAQ